MSVASPMQKKSNHAAKTGAIITAICVTIVVLKNPDAHLNSSRRTWKEFGLFDETTHADETTSATPASANEKKTYQTPHQESDAAPESQAPGPEEQGERHKLSHRPHMVAMGQAAQPAAPVGWLGAASAQASGAANAPASQPTLTTRTQPNCRAPYCTSLPYHIMHTNNACHIPPHLTAPYGTTLHPTAHKRTILHGNAHYCTPPHNRTQHTAPHCTII